jgi:DNA-binding SARP family transcriptional activator/tetratricopeptide (TPR) repeat protein
VDIRFPQNKEVVFVGREHEMKILGDNYDSILENQGSFVLIEGETGIGKTSLVEQFLDCVKSRGATVIQGHGYHKEISPYRLFSEMLRDYFSSINYDTRYLAPLFDNLTISLMQKIIPELEDYIPFDISRISTPPLSPQEEKQRFYDMLLLFFSKLSHRSPLVLSIEDLHWLEPDTLELLRYLVTNFRRSPIMLIATSRGLQADSFTQSWVEGLEDQRMLHRLQLSGLKSKEVKSLAEALFNHQLTDNLFGWLLDYTAGNPLFINESVRAGIEQDAFFFDPVESRWDIKEEYSEGILRPANLQSVIERRLKGLDKPSQKVLSFAAVVGDRFDLETLQELSDLHPAQLKRIVGNLMVKNLIQKISDKEGDKGSYRFTHHIVRLHIYQDLSPELKEKTHQKVAILLEKEKGKAKLSEKVEDLAYHFTRSKKNKSSMKKSIKYLIQAGQEMRRQFSENKAEQYLLQAQDLLKNMSPSKEKNTNLLKLLDLLGEVQSRIGKSAAAIQSYQEVLKLGETEKLLDYLGEAQIYRKIGYAYHSLSDYSRAISYYERSLKGLKDTSSEPELTEYITICNLFGLTYIMKGEHQKCVDWSEKGIKLAKGKKHLPLLEKSYNNLGWVAYSQGKFDQAIEYFNRCLEIQYKVQDKSRLSALKINLGVIHLNLGMYDKAEEYYHKGLNLAQEMGNLAWKGIIYNNLGVLYRDRGEWEKALGFLEKSLIIRQQYEDRRGMVSALDNLGMTFLALGQPEKALDFVSRSFAICKEIGAKDIWSEIQTDLGKVHLKLNHHQEGFDLINGALDIATKQSSKSSMGIAKRALGQFYMFLEEWKKAEELLCESNQIFEEIKSPFQQARTLQSLGFCLVHMAVSEKQEEKRVLLQRSIQTLNQATTLFSQLNLERRLIFLKDKIKQSPLCSELTPTLKEIEQKTTHEKVKREGEEKPESPMGIGISGDYIDYLRIYCFGRFRVYRPYETEEILAKEWGSVKAKQILACLVVKDPKRLGITRDKLVDAIWPEIDPQSLGNTFHVTLSHLRKAIGREKGDYLQSKTGVYRLNWEGKVWSDVGEFLSCLDNAFRFQKEQKQHLMDAEFQKAAELYSSNLLEDFYERWSEEARDEYREKYNIVFWRLARSAWDKSDYEKCIHYLQSLLLADPADEEAHRMIMLSYALLGSRTAAIRQFKVCEENLKRYLEIEPEPETVNLHKKIKHGNPRDYRKLLSLVG